MKLKITYLRVDAHIKNPGSRGGKIIGRTKSGEPIYASSKAKKGFASSRLQKGNVGKFGFREGTKKSKMMQLVSRTEGATNAEIFNKTGLDFRDLTPLVEEGRVVVESTPSGRRYRLPSSSPSKSEKAGRVLFHGTSSEAVAGIKKHGLIPGRGKGADEFAKSQGWSVYKYDVGERAMSVFMAHNKEDAETYADYASDVAGGESVMLQITVPSTHVHFIKEDEQQPGLGVRFVGGIPPDWIKQVRIDEDIKSKILHSVIAVSVAKSL